MSTDDISEPERYDYDLVVVGTGPGGQKAAIAAAKLGHKVAIIERRHMMGGVSTNTGTIPSKTLREAVMYLTGMAQREVYGASYRVKSDITMEDLFARTQHVIGREHEVIRAQLLRNHIDILSGTGSYDYLLHAVVADPAALDLFVRRLKREAGAGQTFTRLALRA